jgi:hypothetical protein
MQTATIKFRPLEKETLELLLQVNCAHDHDPVATYGRLISAASVAAAIIGLRPELVAQQVEAFVGAASEAVRDRPDIFSKSEPSQ